MKYPYRSIALRLAIGIAAAAAAQAMAADAGDVEQLRSTTLRLIDLLVEQGVLTRAKADELVEKARQPAPSQAATASAGAASAPVVRVPYVPEFIRKQMKEEIRAELVQQAEAEGWAKPGTVPSWTRGLAWDGDLRFRTQEDHFPSGNAPAVNVSATNSSRTLVALNTTEDRTRLRMRARAGLTATIDEHWSGGVRLTTGNLTDPTSSNQTLGIYNDRYTVAFDRAYIRYQYGEEWSGMAGRFGNPWFGTDLVWAPDLSFDGITAQWAPALGSQARGFVTLAALPIQEVELSTADKWLLGAQVGANLPVKGDSWGGRIGLGYYRYKNTVGELSPASAPTVNEYTAPLFAQKGNTYYNISSDLTRPLLGLASDYGLLNLTGTVEIPFGGHRVTLTGDYVKNLAYDRAAVSARVGSDVKPMTQGYQVRLAFGDPDLQRFGQWQVYAAYKYLERDAVMDAFTDSDFHLGGTDARGYILGGSYGLGRNTYATLRYLNADAISSVPLAVDVFQLDLNVRF